MDAQIETLADRVLDRYDQGSVDPEVKVEVSQLFPVIAADLRRVGDREETLDFVLQYLQRERDKFQADDPTDHSYNGNRTEPLCGCPDPNCDLKEGNLPPDVRMAETPREGIREFRERHLGTPYVLDEAQEELGDRMGRLAQMLALMDTALANQTSLTDLGVDVGALIDAGTIHDAPDAFPDLDPAADPTSPAKTDASAD